MSLDVIVLAFRLVRPKPWCSSYLMFCTRGSSLLQLLSNRVLGDKATWQTQPYIVPNPHQLHLTTITSNCMHYTASSFWGDKQQQQTSSSQSNSILQIPNHLSCPICIWELWEEKYANMNLTCWWHSSLWFL